MRFINEDEVIRAIERFDGYLDEDMIERIKIAIKKVPTASSELIADTDPIIKRFRHLIESDFIRSFDAIDPSTQEYKRDIREADKLMKVMLTPEKFPNCKHCTPCGICEVCTNPGVTIAKCKFYEIRS